MNGRAPNWRATGSQVEVHRKAAPKVRSAGRAFQKRMAAIASAIATTVSAKTSVTARNAGSPKRRRGVVGPVAGWGRGRGVVAGRETGRVAGTTGVSRSRAGVAPGRAVSVVLPTDLDLAERLPLEGDDRGRQRRVAELGGELLAVAEHPLEERLDRLALAGVVDAARDQEPGEAGDWIRLRPLRVGDRHTEIGRHICRGRGGGGGHALQTVLHVLAGTVADVGIGE